MLSFQFLDEKQVLAVIVSEEDDEESEDQTRSPLQQPTSSDTRSSNLAVHDIGNLRNSEDAQTRVYQLPDSWSDATSIQIEPNTSPIAESRIVSGTLFYPDPARRIFVVVVTFPLGRIPVDFSPRSVVIVNDSIFKSTIPDGSTDIPWSRWRRHCLIRELSHGARCLHVVGSRLLFSEAAPGLKNSPHTSRSCVRSIDFNPHAAECIQSSTRSRAPWTWVGPWTTITAVETHRYLPHVRTRTADSYEISKFYATEDNLILLKVCSN